jgi:hypothetical protein
MLNRSEPMGPPRAHGVDTIALFLGSGTVY